MDRPTAKKVGLTGFGLWWLGGTVLTFVACIVATWCKAATELTPDHGDISLPAGLAAGVLTLVVIAAQSSQANPWRRFGAALVVALMATGSIFYLTATVTELLNMRADFPPSRTRTYQDFVRIGRAYQTHGRGTHWHIQTMPYWSDLDIDERDYGFMLAHRQPGDTADEIHSPGYFCAYVTMQASGNALRILHTRGTLPAGTVVICPADGPRPMP